VLKTLTGLAATAALILPSTALAGPANPPVDCTGGTISFDGADSAWPPNHKFRTFSITATPDMSMDMVSLMTTATHDEYLEDGTEMNGAGHTAVDAQSDPATGEKSGTGAQTVIWYLRGERSGRGDGRVYTLSADATFGMGTMPCHAEFHVTVPHDQRNKNRA